MNDAEIIVAMQDALGLRARGELEHFLTCGGCYLADYDGSGPCFCRAFEIEFRGYVPRELTPDEQARAGMLQALWAPLVEQALTRGL